MGSRATYGFLNLFQKKLKTYFVSIEAIINYKHFNYD